MGRDEADRQICSGVPGIYTFELAQYEEVPEFLREFRRYESICRTRGYGFQPSLSAVPDPPFDAFDITIPATGVELPFVACSRNGMSRKLPRM